MISPVNRCLIKADKNRDVNIKLKGGVTLVLPPSVKKFQEHQSHIVTQDGVVIAAPQSLNSGLPVEIKEGDHVYGHHFMCNSEKEVLINGEACYSNDYDSIYCKVDTKGNITMVGQWNFVVPIYPPIDDYLTKSGILLTYKHDEIPNVGKIIYPSKQLQAQGIKQGDLVIFKDDCEYDIMIGDVMFYRIHDKNITGSIENIEYQEKKEIMDVRQFKMN